MLPTQSGTIPQICWLVKVQMGALKWGLKATLCNSCAIVCNFAHLLPFGPFCKGNFHSKMMPVASKCGQLKATFQFSKSGSSLNCRNLTKPLIHWIACRLFTEESFFALKSASSHPLPQNHDFANSDLPLPMVLRAWSQSPEPYAWRIFCVCSTLFWIWSRRHCAQGGGVDPCLLNDAFAQDDLSPSWTLAFTRPNLSGPVRDTPRYRAIPFQDSIAEGGIAPICLVFIGYRASIAEIPLLRGGGVSHL